MASMYPDPIPEWVPAEGGWATERRMYEALARGLDDRFVVLYNVPFVVPPDVAPAHDGEVDFIILHPAHGILLLEVKGGSVSRDGKTGVWTSVTGDGKKHRFRDPFKQLTDAMYDLKRKLQGLPAGRKVTEFGRAIAFPQSPRPERDLGPEAPLDVLFTAEDVHAPQARVESIYRFWRKHQKHPVRLTADDIRELVEFLSPTVSLRCPLGFALKEQEREIVRLTRNECEIFQRLKLERRVAVSGGAGTGKTFLAMATARRLASKGLRVLVTCINRPLSDFLRKSVGRRKRIRVAHFHKLCFEMAKKAGIALPTTTPRKRFDETFPRALMDAMNALPEERFDAIIVDELQDFRQRAWEALQSCLEDREHGILYVFYDDNQRLWAGEPPFIEGGFTRYCLNENLRNTREIHRAALQFYAGEGWVSGGPKGEAFVWPVTVKQRDEIEQAAVRVLDTLVRRDAIEPREIAVLVGPRIELSVFADRRIGPFGTTENQFREPEKVLLQPIHRFKGLERRVVVLADIDSLAEKTAMEHLYVGVTRPRTYLVVISTKETRQRYGLHVNPDETVLPPTEAGVT